ncbi:MAG TPA: HD-GYP domain-containing protein [Solirubrobacteraceae bacterium]|nr:HD-GYP domain-containing protein [Solirubrobacteraceae bacterium]
MSAYAIIESERARTSFLRQAQGIDAAERWGELIVGGGFVCAAVALAVASGMRGADEALSPALGALYVVGVAVAGRIRIDVGSGFTVPTQAVFVPMLFALPLGLVPLLVALALALGMTPAVLGGREPPSRLLTVPANSWFALGPSLVLVLAHDHSPTAGPAVLVLALAAQFACDFTASAVRERMCGGISTRELIGEVGEVYLIDAALAPLGLAVALAAVEHSWAVLLIAPLFAILRIFSKERRARLEQLIELGDAYRGTALVLGDVVEADDAYTGEHCRGVVRLALGVAQELGLDAHRRRNVEFGALLHDVGKIAVPKEIINKPGKLDEREWEIIKTHTIEGQRMLERVGGFMREVGEIVRSSHERWDGTGYPDGLRGAAIPLEARIVSACDALNAMTTTRSYRRAMSLPDALAELTRCADTQFDPQVVEALAKLVRRDPAGAPAPTRTAAGASLGQ